MNRSTHWPDLRRREFHHILIVKPSSLGDVIHAFPVLHGLRTRYPKAKIDWLISTPFAPLLQGHSDLDEVLPFDRSLYSRVVSNPKAAVAFLRFLRNLQRQRHDLVVDLQGLFRSGFLSFASRAPVRIGFSDSREGAWLFYTHRIPRGEINVHAVDRNYRVARILGFEDVPVEFPMAVRSEAKAQVESFLKPTMIGESLGPLVGVVPGARWETKMWSPERFSRVIDRIHGDHSARVVLLGGSGDVSLCEKIAADCSVPALNLAGQTTLDQLVAAIDRCDLVLCQDSAAAHIAAGLGRPLVCLVGPTNPHRTGPYKRFQDVVRHDVECSPCYLRRLSQCPHEQKCMSDLEVDRVVEAVSERIRGFKPLTTKK
ncbi:MAG: lipopolysaccharide heptosyltransferase II [Planctomycetota bacterium]